MAVKLSDETVRRIEKLVQIGEFSDADLVVGNALSLLEREDEAYWRAIARLDAVADEDIALGRLKRVDDAFIQRLRSRVDPTGDGRTT